MKAGRTAYAVERFRVERAPSDQGFVTIVYGWFHAESGVRTMQLTISTPETTTYNIADYACESADVAQHFGGAAANARFKLVISSRTMPKQPTEAIINITLVSGDIHGIDITNVFKPYQSLPSIAAGDLVMRFESLGDNCEFGLLQRAVGAERLGLFRFAGVLSASALARGIDDGFEGFATKEDLEFHTAGTEWIGVSRRYGYVFHTHRYQPKVTEEQIAEEESARLPFLARLVLEDIEDGDKIFVRRAGSSEGTDLEEGMHALNRALRARGPTNLLWVTQGDHAPRVVHIGEGLYRGYIGRLAPYADAHDFSASDWVLLLSLARDMIDRGEADAGAAPPQDATLVGSN